MNNNDGALSFDATIDNEQLNKAVLQSENLIKNFSDSAVADFAKIDDAIAKTAQRMEMFLGKTNAQRFGDVGNMKLPTLNIDEIAKQREAFDEAKRQIAGLNSEIKEFEKRQKTLPEGSSGWNEMRNRIVDAKSAVSAYTKELETARAKINSLTNTKTTNPKVSVEGVEKAKSDIKGLSSTTQQETSKMEGYFKNLSVGFGAYFSLATLKSFTTQLIQVRGEFQQTSIALETILRSKEKADKLMSEIVTFAAETPFGLRSASTATKQLLAYGSAANQVMGELKMLGNIASGVSQPIGDLAYLYGTLRTQGRAYAMDLRQFAGRGIPIYQALADVLKVNKDEINKLVEAGKIGFPEVQKALQSMTNENGKFFNLMEKQTASLTGQTEKLSDAFDMMLNDIGSKSGGVLTTGISSAAYLVENYENVIKIIGVLISTYGTYKAALITVNALEKAVAGVNFLSNVVNLTRAMQGLTTVSKARAVALGIEATAQKALTAVMAINPYVLAATAIAALVTTIWALYDGTTTQEKAQKQLNETLENAVKKKEELESTTTQLVSIVNSETKTILDQITAYKELQSLYPQYLKNMDMHAFKAMSTTQQQKLLNQALNDVEFDNLNSEISKVENKIAELTDKIEDSKKDSSVAGDYVLMMEWEIKKQEEVLNGLKDEQYQREENKKEADFENLSQQEKIKYLNEQLKNLQQQKIALENNVIKANDLNSVFAQTPDYLNNTNIALSNILSQMAQVQNQIKNISASGDVVKNQDYWSSQKKSADEALKSMDEAKRGSKEWNTELQKIREAESHLKTWDFSAKASKNTRTKKQEIYPYGSLKYWEQVARKADEIISKTPASNLALIEKENQIKLNAEKEVEKIRKLIAVRNFNEEIEYKQKVYNQYYKWVENLGKESADKEFSTLLKEGDDFAKYLENKRNELLKKQSQGNLIQEDGANLFLVTDQLNEINGIKSAIDRFKDSLSDAKDESNSLFRYLEQIAEARQKIESGETSLIGEQKTEGINFLKEEEKQAQKEILKNIQETYKDFEQQRVEINQVAEDKIKFARENGLSDRIELINKERTKMLGELRATELQGTKLWKSLFNNMGKISIKTFKSISGELKKIINAIEDPDIRDEFQKQLDDYEKSISNPIKKIENAIKKYNDAKKKLEQALNNGDEIDIKVATGEAEASLNSLINTYLEFGSQAVGVLKALSDGMKQLGVESQEANDIIGALEGVVDAVAGYFSGNYAQMASGIIGLVMSVASLFDKKSKKLQKETNRLKSELAEITRGFANLEYAASNAVGEDYYSVQTEKIQNLIAQQEKLNELIANEEKKRKKKKDNGAIEEWKNQINDINNQIKDIERQIVESFAQTNFKDLSNQLADVFTSAFSEGKSAAKDFEKVFNNVISNAIKNALKMKILEPVVNDFIENVSDYMSGNNNSLSGFNFDYWKSLLSTAGSQFTGALEEFEKFFNVLDPSQLDPLTGAIKGVTEETASLIAGQMNAIRINQVVATDFIKQQLLSLHQIEVNTYTLHSILKILNAMYGKSLSSGDSLKAVGITSI